jgi:hypothetical protein
MKRSSFRLLATAALFASAIGFAPLATADDKPAGAAVDQADSRVPAPPAGKGQIVFFRPFGAGMALNPMVREDTTDIGRVGTSSYFIYVADPGPHVFSVKSEASDTLHMEVDVGETYYVEETIGMGVMVGRPHLTPSDAAAFAKLKGLKLTHTAEPKPSETAKTGSN